MSTGWAPMHCSAGNIQSSYRKLPGRGAYRPLATVAACCKASDTRRLAAGRANTVCIINDSEIGSQLAMRCPKQIRRPRRPRAALCRPGAECSPKRPPRCSPVFTTQFHAATSWETWLQLSFAQDACMKHVLKTTVTVVEARDWQRRTSACSPNCARSSCPDCSAAPNTSSCERNCALTTSASSASCVRCSSGCARHA